MPVKVLARRLAAVVVLLALIGMVVADEWVGAFRTWWDRHSLTGSIVSSLLVVAVTGLIVDEVVARRQRRARSSSVAVQAVIVYGQAGRTFRAITDGDGDELSSGATEELRTLASMLLTASPNLFDDPIARRFLTQLQRVTGSMFKLVLVPAGQGRRPADRVQLEADMAELKTTAAPLLARISIQDQSRSRGRRLERNPPSVLAGRGVWM